MGAIRRVVIAGAGVAAIEAVLALRALAGSAVEIEVLAPGEAFLYRPVTVAEAFDAGEAPAFDLDEILREQGVRRHVDALVAVDADARVVYTRAGALLPYDDLIVALGARAAPVVPGALTFRGRPDVPALRATVSDLAAGRISRIAFAVPDGSTWPLPLYELALLASSRVDGPRAAHEILLVTPEQRPVELFGAHAGQAVAELLEARGIRLHTQARPLSFDQDGLHLAGGATLPVDRVVTLPRYHGRRIPGLPHDTDGFLPVDLHGRVLGLEGVYAAGDATWFPLKQGGLATQQADAIAEIIASHAGAPVTPRPFRPVVRGMLLTGGEPIYLRAGAAAGRQHPSVTSEDLGPSTPTSGGRLHESSSSTRALWWPPSKIAGRYLGPYLATARPQPLARSPQIDLAAPRNEHDDAESGDAAQLALALADCDARWGDYEMALAALDSAQALGVTPTEDYAARRAEWTRALQEEA